MAGLDLCRTRIVDCRSRPLRGGGYQSLAPDQNGGCSIAGRPGQRCTAIASEIGQLLSLGKRAPHPHVRGGRVASHHGTAAAGRVVARGSLSRDGHRSAADGDLPRARAHEAWRPLARVCTGGGGADLFLSSTRPARGARIHLLAGGGLRFGGAARARDCAAGLRPPPARLGRHPSTTGTRGGRRRVVVFKSQAEDRHAATAIDTTSGRAPCRREHPRRDDCRHCAGSARRTRCHRASGTAAVVLDSGAERTGACRSIVDRERGDRERRRVEAQKKQEVQPEPRSRDEVRFVFFSDETTTMSGNRGDVERARSLRSGGEPILWFMRDGKEYVVRDPGTLKQLQELWVPVNIIGAEQGRVGAQQGEVGAKQGHIGARQGRIGAEQGVVGARQAEIGARQGELAAREVRQQASERERAELRAERRTLEERMQRSRARNGCTRREDGRRA